MRLTDQKKKLLEDAVENDGVLEMRNAFKIYSSKEAAKNAVKTLEAYDFVEYIEAGYFDVVALPEELQHLESEIKEEESGREFVKKILEKVFNSFESGKTKPEVDSEEVKYATKELNQ